MSTSAKTQMKAVQKPSTTNAQTGFLQRKCDKCRKKKPLLQRSAVGPALDNVPLVVHEVLPSSWAQDTAKRDFISFTAARRT